MSRSLVRLARAWGISPDRPLFDRCSSLKVGQLAQLQRNRARQVVAGEIERLQIGQIAQVSGNAPGEVVGVEVQSRQAIEISKLGRYRTHKVVFGQ